MDREHLRTGRLVLHGLLLSLGLLAGGCASMTPGEMSAVQPYSDRPRAGNVYLLRGWIGIFSYGINDLNTEINQNGVRANVYQDDQWSDLAGAIRQKYAGVRNPEPLILIGHSYGADDVLHVARQLGEKKIAVDLVVTLDAVSPPEVPANVRRCYNLYQSNKLMDGIPMFRGLPVKAADGSLAKIENGDVRTNRVDLLEPGLDHFNIEKKQKIHADVIKQVLATCPPRQSWAASAAATAQPAGAGLRSPIAPMQPAVSAVPTSRSPSRLDAGGSHGVNSAQAPTSVNVASHASQAARAASSSE